MKLISETSMLRNLLKSSSFSKDLMLFLQTQNLHSVFRIWLEQCLYWYFMQQALPMENATFMQNQTIRCARLCCDTSWFFIIYQQRACVFLLAKAILKTVSISLAAMWGLLEILLVLERRMQVRSRILLQLSSRFRILRVSMNEAQMPSTSKGASINSSGMTPSRLLLLKEGITPPSMRPRSMPSHLGRRERKEFVSLTKSRARFQSERTAMYCKYMPSILRFSCSYCLGFSCFLTYFSNLTMCS